MSGPTSSNNKKGYRRDVKKNEGKEETPNSVQKLLAALQNAQNKKENVDDPFSKLMSAKPSSSTSSENKKQTKPEKKSQNKKNKTILETLVSNLNQNVYTVDKTQQLKKKKEKGSVGSRMQQQQHIPVEAATKRRRTTSKNPQQQPPQTQNPPTNPPSNYKGPRIPQDVLDDLEFRFISNIPDADKKCHVRVCFQVELAHWFYVDHIVESEGRKDCPNIGIRDFTRILFLHCRELRRLAMNVDDVIAEWRNYKSTVPTYGAILIDESLERVLLVQSYFSKGNNWGFPKGKVNQNENPRDCAIRETCEETGFDFGTISNKEKKLQKFINDSMVRLYVVPNVPASFPFAPQTRKEIRKIEWFKIFDLPTEKGDEPAPYLSGYKFFMILPFINEIRRFVEKELDKRHSAKSVAPEPLQKQESHPINVERPSILSQLFPEPTQSWNNTPSCSQVNEPNPILKRMTSEELIASFRPSLDSGLSRPSLPNMSPSAGGLNALATLGLCTPLRGTNNVTQFPIAVPSETCPVIQESTENEKTPSRRPGLFQEEETETLEEDKPVMGFAMPTTLQKPVVTSSHPWQNQKKGDGAEVKEEAYHGWLDSQLVNTIMHAPTNQRTSPATPPIRSHFSHLISKPIQPQPIIPVAATQSALGSAEAPKRSSRISLSGNSAFTAIASKQQSSAAKSTLPPSGSHAERNRTDSIGQDARVESRGSTITPQAMMLDEPVNYLPRSARNLFSSIVSPASSGMVSIHGNSTSSLAASLQELSAINKDIFSPELFQHTNNVHGVVKPETLALCERWQIPIKIEMLRAVGPVENWEKAFSLRA